MSDKTKVENKEYELPDTTYIRDIESRVFQSITLQCLAKIKGISLLGGTIIDNLLGRESFDRIKGIHVEQDQKKHSVYIRVEINVEYGVAIPEKSEEIQTKVIEEITSLTGLHVSCVHVIFKNLIVQGNKENQEEPVAVISEEYDEGF